MFEKSIESKPGEFTETLADDLATRMLEEFHKKLDKKFDDEVFEEVVLSEDEEDEINDDSGLPHPITPDELDLVEVPGSDFKPEKAAARSTIKEFIEETYDSVATTNYFDHWNESFELDGNPELKNKIRENVIHAEKINQAYYRKLAEDLEITVEELKLMLQARVEDLVGKSDFFRATDVDILEKIMNIDERWKSQFETNTSHGTLDPEYRSAKERDMFGFEYDLENNKEKRPIYGYFSDDEHGGINYESGKIPPPTNVRCYGSINFKIKKERALKKATLTFHDSLYPGSVWPPTPAIKPHFTSLSIPYITAEILNTLKNSSITNWGQGYTEVQYHGQLTMDDVESIHVSTGNRVDQEEINEVRKIFMRYKEQHPESTIELIEF